MTLLQMSFYGAVIILAILLIRAFTLHKLPKKTFLILWGVALLRLLVPFEISSGFSLYSLLPEGNISYIPDRSNPYEPFENYADYLQEQEVEAIPLPDTVTVTEDTGGTATAPDSQASAGRQTIWNSLVPFLPLIWVTGMLLCAAFFLISYIRCYREFCTSLPVTTEYVAEWLKQHPLKRTISIRRTDKISAPLTYGIFRPVILLPKNTDWSNTTQLDYILYHEFTHIRRFDLLAKLLMIAALCLHWFNPFVWAMYVFFNRDLELSCDDCVVKHFGETKSAYANTLIGMEEKRNYGTPLCNHFSKNAIEERITAIMKLKKTTFGMLAAAVIIVAVVIVTLTTGRKDDKAVPEITPVPTTTSTPTAEPTPPPGDILYFPERNYTYREDDLAVFNYSSSTVSPKNGYDFIISSLVSEDGSPVLSDVTINLEAYAGNTAWWCLAAFYDKDTGRFYLEFVPAAGVADAPAGVLHVTVPVTDPTGYTVLPTGDFHAQKSSAFWFGEIRKIRNRIYFNNGYYDGSLWVLDVTTGEMQDLSYVNEKMQDIANELCSDFGWDNQPTIWFNAAQQQGDDTYVYTASICKEVDTGTIYTLYLYYDGDAFIDFATAYHGSTEQPPSIEELTSLCQEQFFRYRTMHMELFNSGLECGMHSHQSVQDVTINGVDHYYKVLDERFPTLQSVIDYMETICTPELAERLRREHLGMGSDDPLLAELNGELYTKYYSSSTNGYFTDFQFTGLEYIDADTVTTEYQSSSVSPDVIEVGTITFRITPEGWRIASLDYEYQNLAAKKLPSYSQLKDVGAAFETSAADNHNIGMFYFRRTVTFLKKILLLIC